MNGLYAIIRRRAAYKYGEAMLSPVMMDGRCQAAVDHGSVVDLTKRARASGRRVLATLMEPFDGLGLWQQEKQLAKLVEEAAVPLVVSIIWSQRGLMPLVYKHDHMLGHGLDVLVEVLEQRSCHLSFSSMRVVS